MERDDDVATLVNEAIKKSQTDLGKVTVLIAGRTGVGKSTLINSIFHENLAATGQGKPVTETTKEITKKDFPLTILDTRGLEMSDFAKSRAELMRLVKERAAEPEAECHIHVAWLCIHEDGRRVEDADIELCKELAGYMPVLAVITRAC